MDGFFWKVGAMPSICIFASCSCACLLDVVDDVLLGADDNDDGPPPVLELWVPDGNHDDMASSEGYYQFNYLKFYELTQCGTYKQT